jgi:hypothetical protein
MRRNHRLVALAIMAGVSTSAFITPASAQTSGPPATIPSSTPFRGGSVLGATTDACQVIYASSPDAGDICHNQTSVINFFPNPEQEAANQSAGLIQSAFNAIGGAKNALVAGGTAIFQGIQAGIQIFRAWNIADSFRS